MQVALYDEYFPPSPQALFTDPGWDPDSVNRAFAIEWHRPRGALYVHSDRCGDVVASQNLDDKWLLGALGILATRRELMLDLFVSDENAHRGQGLTLVHFSAQPEPFMKQTNTLNTL